MVDDACLCLLLFLLSASRLLLVHLDDVVLLHFQRLWSLVVVDAPAVEEEPERNTHVLVIMFILAHTVYITCRLLEPIRNKKLKKPFTAAYRCDLAKRCLLKCYQQVF